jgi:CPA1 family monovalent cation:H+ antiporter
MPYNARGRWLVRRGAPRTRDLTMMPTVGSGLVISWAGMRGIVTIAAALALPAAANGRRFRFGISYFCQPLALWLARSWSRA